MPIILSLGRWKQEGQKCEFFVGQVSWDTVYRGFKCPSLQPRVVGRTFLLRNCIDMVDLPVCLWRIALIVNWDGKYHHECQWYCFIRHWIPHCVRKIKVIITQQTSSMGVFVSLCYWLWVWCLSSCFQFPCVSWNYKLNQTFVSLSFKWNYNMSWKHKQTDRHKHTDRQKDKCEQTKIPRAEMVFMGP